MQDFRSLYIGIDLSNPILFICILYDSESVPEEACRKKNLNALNSLFCLYKKCFVFVLKKFKVGLCIGKIPKLTFFCELLYRIF